METPHILYINQKVKDIKVAGSTELEDNMGRLRAWLHQHCFIPGDKVPATVTPHRIEDGVLIADISGKMLSSDLDTSVHIHQRFPLPLNGYNGPMDVETIFSNAPGTRVDDGGNIQNMVINTALAALCTRRRNGEAAVRLTIASSSDPFSRMKPDLGDALRGVCELFPLDVSDRFAIQVPWRADDQAGTLAITSEPQRTGEAVRKLCRESREFRRAMESATCIVSSDPIYDQLHSSVKPPYSYVINASTAFRSLVAAESYGRTAILPMNNDEASDVCKLLLQRGLEEELGKIDRPPFPPPLTPSGDAIDQDGLRELDHSVEMLLRYIFPHKNHGRPSFTCPISFGPYGGMLIGVDHESFACFSSTPSSDGERALINEFGKQEVDWARKYEVGAGDAVAAVITLFNAIDPGLLIVAHMRDREHTDRQLRQLACTIFVSVLGRIAGNFLIRTPRTYWDNVRSDGLLALVDQVARESLCLARTIVRKVHAPVVMEIKRWGIHVVLWRPGAVAYPERQG